jgi:hypothetical protein
MIAAHAWFLVDPSNLEQYIIAAHAFFLADPSNSTVYDFTSFQRSNVRDNTGY